jgi:hypothetical protein
MAQTVDPEAQELEIRQIAQYVHENAYFFFICSPVSLNAVNYR